MKKLMGGTTLLAGFALLAAAATALATSSLGVTSTTIAQGSVADDIQVHVKTGDWKVKLDTKGPSTLAVTENKVAPGGHFGWHSHPGPSLVVVKSGAATEYHGDDADCTPEVHRAGTAFVDAGGGVHIVRNEGSVELVVIVTRLVPEGVAPRTDEPNPGNCGF